MIQIPNRKGHAMRFLPDCALLEWIMLEDVDGKTINVSFDNLIIHLSKNPEQPK